MDAFCLDEKLLIKLNFTAGGGADSFHHLLPAITNIIIYHF